MTEQERADADLNRRLGEEGRRAATGCVVGFLLALAMLALILAALVLLGVI